jgi:transcriptional regulator with GAF, ATPase, and Fis domain
MWLRPICWQTRFRVKSQIHDFQQRDLWNFTNMATKQLIAAEDCRRLLLAMSQQSSAEDVLNVLVTGLAEYCGAALARVWRVIPKDKCAACRDPELCAARSECLQLAASAGRSLGGRDWSGIDGAFARMPLGYGKIGHIAETRQPVEEKKIDIHSPWVAEPEWIQNERIRGLIGQPLLYQNQLLGVLAVFTRESPTDNDLAWLRAFADHAAIAISNSRAFAEIQALRRQLETENEYLRSEMKDVQSYGEIVGTSPAIQNLRSRISLVAPTDATVLIQGASGTGKELVARAIHEQSRRARQPLITVNCAAIPRDLFESEFFGHVKGSFSGATQNRIGRFQLADRGTLLLDEVGEIPLEMQGKLLRVLEQGTFERVGDERTTQVDVRVIAATNRDLANDVRDSRFRQDLYFRLNIFPIDVPPLAARPEDAAVLAQHFLSLYCRKYRVQEPRLTRHQIDQLNSYAWPGNVRELRNVMERAVITLLSQESPRSLDFRHLSQPGPGQLPELKGAATVPRILTEQEIRRLERDNLIAVMKQTKWKVSGSGGAAELLGVNPATLASRLRAFGVSRSHHEQTADDSPGSERGKVKPNG